MKKANLIAFFVLGIGFFLMIGWMATKKSSDEKGYHQLQATLDKKKGSPLSLPVQQVRKGVVKEVWLRQKEPQRLVQKCQKSELFFIRDGKKVTLFEKLENIHTIVQEELFYLTAEGKEVKQEVPGAKKMQIVRELYALKGSYSYDTKVFVGEEVEMFKYKLTGHELPLEGLSHMKPLMRGHAKKAQVSLQGDKIDFRLFQFKATFDPEEGV